MLNIKKNRLLIILSGLPLLMLTFFACTQQKPSVKKTALHAEKNSSLDAEPTGSKHSNQSNKLEYISGVRSILHDSKGNYWFGAHQEGVCLYDGKTYTYFGMTDGLADNQVRSIHEDEFGTIWFGTANGLSSYYNGELKTHREVRDETSGKVKEAEDWAISDSDLWIGSGDGAGAYRIHKNDVNFYYFPTRKDSSVSSATTGHTQGVDNSVWVSTYSWAVGFDGESFSIIDNERLNFVGELIPKLHIRSIFSDSKGNLWIGNNGIGVLLKQGDDIINFSDKHGLIHANTSGSGGYSPPGTLEHVFAIEEDKDGNIWFGDRDTGVWKYDGKTITNYIIAEEIKSLMTWDIYRDKNDNLLFAMANGKVYQFNGEDFDLRFDY